MEEKSFETPFDTLPVKLQIDILQFLKRKDIKSARLVCTYWFRLLSYIRPIGVHLNNNKIDLLLMVKESFHSTLKFIRVSNYTDILPICTSIRCGIPKSEFLLLGAGNSVENILKLLRNYAKSCFGLGIYSNCFEEVAAFRLKGLAYKNLHSLGIKFELPLLNGSQDFGKHNHLNALIQFLKTTKLPNLQILDVQSPRRLIDGNSNGWKFNQAINGFFGRHGKHLTHLKYCCIPPSVLVQSFQHLYNLEDLWIEFNDVRHYNINDVRDALKNIKKLKILECSDFSGPNTVNALRLRTEFVLTMLQQNRNSIKKIYLDGFHTRIDFIPVDCELQLREIELYFVYLGENTLTISMNAHRELKPVTKLDLNIKHADSQDLMVQIFSWIVSFFPNLKNLAMNCPRITLKHSDFRFLVCNLVRLKKVFIKSGYRGMTHKAFNWFKQNSHPEFIKSTLHDGGLEVLINRPFPNFIFD